MHFTSRIAALVAVGSVLAACSGGGAVVPSSGTRAGQASAAGSRFIDSAATAADTAEFTYNADPPTKPFLAAAQVPNALPPPSVCEQIYGLACYTPAEIRTAYDVPSAYDGSGQTIVIVDAYGSPTIRQDVAAFDGVMGLPDPPLTIMYPGGQPAPFELSALRIGWAGEVSLDVEWAHAIAPKAAIDLVIAPTSLSSDLHAAEEYAIANHLGNVMSMSFGADEPSIPGGAQNRYLQHADSLYQKAKAAGITMIASAGDEGATNGGSVLTPEFPASDPLVLSVGGTSLLMSDTGAYEHETVWNDTDPAQCPIGCVYGPQPGATGGAPSSLFKAPSYQQSLFHPASREVADVSYNAGVYTAVLVAESFRTPGQPYFYFVGGTSAGAPQWAGIITLANQAAGHPMGFVNQKLYNMVKTGEYADAFHDITSGSNGFFGELGESAGPGYDMPTGLGSPKAANLIDDLVHAK